MAKIWEALGDRGSIAEPYQPTSCLWFSIGLAQIRPQSFLAASIYFRSGIFGRARFHNKPLTRERIAITGKGIRLHWFLTRLSHCNVLLIWSEAADSAFTQYSQPRCLIRAGICLFRQYPRKSVCSYFYLGRCSQGLRRSHPGNLVMFARQGSWGQSGQYAIGITGKPRGFSPGLVSSNLHENA